jgi:hypothetical protein
VWVYLSEVDAEVVYEELLAINLSEHIVNSIVEIVVAVEEYIAHKHLVVRLEFLLGIVQLVRVPPYLAIA